MTNPILSFVREDIKQFFKFANLGPQDPKIPERGPLNNLLAVIQNGLTDRRLLTDLLEIYCLINDMKTGDHYKSTDQMDRYFQPIYNQLNDFDPNHFTHDRFDEIVEAMILREDELTDIESSVLATEDFINQATTRLNQEYNVVSAILESYRK